MCFLLLCSLILFILMRALRFCQSLFLPRHNLCPAVCMKPAYHAFYLIPLLRKLSSDRHTHGSTVAVEHKRPHPIRPSVHELSHRSIHRSVNVSRLIFLWRPQIDQKRILILRVCIQQLCRNCLQHISASLQPGGFFPVLYSIRGHACGHSHPFLKEKRPTGELSAASRGV